MNRRARQRGTSMIEVLISIVIVVLGLLGLAGLQSRAQLAEAEAFQRAQAVMLLQDMVDRINSNRRNSMSYVTTGEGTGKAEQDCSLMTGATFDKCEWSNGLLGAAESAGGLKVGAMIDARGCIDAVTAIMPREFLVTVVWQGVNDTKAPGAGVTCGQGLYGPETKRRALTSRVVIGCLQNTGTGACVTP
jgi:type IV pilus assembly protein PilV